ncbi:hypothetical protein [Stieleria varia]|uniref:Uncharacterized protein n=1 Tax=Stieleria varia TaxID=2528005 RepID=A0A5C6AYB7_9BACT|nr:hypothetical protein [Stieleria varia]TWU04648.1 hypothetical protein Pla52n_26900 [Stieleria varia]
MNIRAGILVVLQLIATVTTGDDVTPLDIGSESRDGILRYSGPFSNDFPGSELQFELSFGHAEFSTRNVFFLASDFQRHPFWIDVDGLEKLSALEKVVAAYSAGKRTPPPEVLKSLNGSFAVFAFRTTSGTVGKMWPGASWVLVVKSAEPDAAKVLLDRIDDDRPPEARVFKSIKKLDSSMHPLGG